MTRTFRADSEVPIFGYIVASWALKWMIPWFAAMTVAWSLIRLRKPRPALRLLPRQPGFLASCLVLLAIGWEAGLALFRFGVERLMTSTVLKVDGSETNCLSDILLGTGSSAGYMIVAAWITLTLAGRFRFERGWIDAIGTGLGACWIGLLLTLEICNRIY